MNLKFRLKNFNLDCDLAHAGSSDHHCVLCKCSFRQFYCTQNVHLFFPVPCSDNEAVGEKTSIGEFQIRFFFPQYSFKTIPLFFLAAGFTLLLEHIQILQNLETIQWQCLVLHLHLVTFITIKWILSWVCFVLFCLPFLAHPLRHNAGMLIVAIKCGMNEVFGRGCGRN